MSQKDVTAMVRECAASLTLSQPFLADQATFDLHDAMSATHITHPKMDSCEIPLKVIQATANEDDRVHPRPPPTGLKDAFHSIPWDELTMEDSAHILLRILSCMRVLFDGASVGESVFTCLYLHEPVLRAMRDELFPGTVEEQMQNLLREKSCPKLAVFASATLLLQFTSLYRTIIVNADIYEEEDFVLNTYDIPMLTEKETLPSAEYAGAALQAVMTIESNNARECVRHALAFQASFIRICHVLANLGTAKIQETVKTTQIALQETILSLEEVQRVALGMKVECESEHVTKLLSRCFDPYVNRPLIGNMPVRRINVKPPIEAISVLIEISQNIHNLVMTPLSKANTLGRTQRMLDRFSKADADILTRSLIILNLYFEDKLMGQYPLQRTIIDLINRRLATPPEYFDADHSKFFLNRLEKPFYDTLKLKVFSRCRQRAYIEAVLIPDWSVLQSEAGQIDGILRIQQQLDASTPPHLSLFVLVVIYQLIDRYLSVNIELSIFKGHHQLSMAYWYRDFILTALLQHLTQMKSAKDNHAKLAEAKEALRKKKKGKNSKPKQKTAEDLEEDYEFVILGIKRLLCRGTFQFLMLLKHAGLLKDPEFEFTSLRTIFQKRFEPFEMLQQPPVLAYEDYVQGSNFSKVSVKDLVSKTAEIFQQCRVTLDQMISNTGTIDSDFVSLNVKDAQALVKVCVGNSVYIRKAEHLISSGSELSSIEFDFTVHAEFCTIKLS